VTLKNILPLTDELHFSFSFMISPQSVHKIPDAVVATFNSSHPQSVSFSPQISNLCFILLVVKVVLHPHRHSTPSLCHRCPADRTKIQSDAIECWTKRLAYYLTQKLFCTSAAASETETLSRRSPPRARQHMRRPRAEQHYTLLNKMLSG